MKSYAYLFKKAWQNYKIAESEPQLTNCLYMRLSHSHLILKYVPGNHLY